MDMPANDTIDLPTFEIWCDGVALPGSTFVTEIETWANVGDVARAAFVILDGSVTTGDYPIADSSKLTLNTPITIAMGYADQPKMRVFDGRITRQSISADKEEGPVLRITCASQEVIPPGTGADGPAKLRVTSGVDIHAFSLAWEEPDDPEFGGQITFIGSAKAHPGDAIDVADVGDRYSGRYGISGVYHRVAQGGWTTQVTLSGKASPH